MLALNKFREENETGFTLLELLVVILIIGILAAIAIPMFLHQRMAAVDATTVSDTHTLATAIETEAIKTPFKDMKTADFSAVPLSAGTKWTMTSNADGYCLQTYNAGGDQYTDFGTAATYDSTAGGMNKSGGECSTATVAASAATGNAIGTPGAISFLDSDSMDAITADGTYSYDAATQSVIVSFDFKNLDPAKTYHILLSATQSQGDIHNQDRAFLDQIVTSANSHVGATMNLKGTNLGGTGPVFDSASNVNLYHGFALNSGYGYADIHDTTTGWTLK